MRRGYLLVVLSALSAFNFLDQQMTSILLEPIRREFSLTDIELGLLSGLVFAALYTVLSVPVGIWAVGHSRRNLIAAAAGVWGAMTIACGFARSFPSWCWPGWASGSGRPAACRRRRHGCPISTSRANARPRSRRSPPASMRACSSPSWSAALSGSIMAGASPSWRRGCRRSCWRCCCASRCARLRFPLPPPRPPVRSRCVRVTLASCGPTALSRQILIGAILAMTVGYGAIAWIPSFLVRSHGLNIAQAGAYLAIVIGLGGALGSLARRPPQRPRSRRDPRWSLWLVVDRLRRRPSARDGVLLGRRRHARAIAVRASGRRRRHPYRSFGRGAARAHRAASAPARLGAVPDDPHPGRPRARSARGRRHEPVRVSHPTARSRCATRSPFGNASGCGRRFIITWRAGCWQNSTVPLGA